MKKPFKSKKEAQAFCDEANKLIQEIAELKFQRRCLDMKIEDLEERYQDDYLSRIEA